MVPKISKKNQRSMGSKLHILMNLNDASKAFRFIIRSCNCILYNTYCLADHLFGILYLEAPQNLSLVFLNHLLRYVSLCQLFGCDVPCFNYLVAFYNLLCIGLASLFSLSVGSGGGGQALMQWEELSCLYASCVFRLPWPVYKAVGCLMNVRE